MRPEETSAPAAAPKAEAPAAAPKAQAPDTTIYGIGVAIAASLEAFSLTPAELETVVKGLRDAYAGHPKAQLDARMQQAVSELARARGPRAAEKAAAREKESGAAYLAKMSKEKGAMKSPSGALVFTQTAGTGMAPTASDKVKVNYTGTLVSGRVFDTSANRGPAEFPLSGVIKCWMEALQMMKAGGKAKVVCPADLAYGPNGNAGIPGNAVLTFEVELLDVVKQ